LNERTGISIAVLSDTQDDVELVNATLRDAGHAAHCKWIANPNQFEEELDNDALELVVQFCEHYADGIRQVVRQKDSFRPELPVIAIQSKVDEAAIQAALDAGARDLVSVGSKSRWLAVVDRELRALRIERALNSTVISANEYKRQLHDYMQSSDRAIAYAQDGIVTKANTAWQSLFRAADEDEVIGMPLMDSFHSGSQAAIKGALVATTKGKWQEGEKLLVKSSLDHGEAAELELRFQLVEFEDGAHVQINVSSQPEVSEEPTKLVHDALQRDPTTLFYHREQFLERVQKRLAKKPDSGLHLLATIKPDAFRKVQEQTGIVASEEILAQLAELVRGRQHPHDLAGRFEGTTIMALLERGNERDAEVWGQQLADQINDHEFTVGEQSVHLTCTVGLCAVSGVYANFEELIAAVVTAGRQGRKKGGNTVCLLDSSDEDTRLRKFDAIWVMHIKAALMDNRFRLAHLPIAGLRKDGTAMFDMLVRMLDEQGNSVLPSEFLPAAERNNLMKTIDRWILTASMDFCRDEKAQCVFVRLSQQSLLDTSLLAWAKQEVAKRKLEPSRLCVQVPEREAAKYIKPTKRIVEGFRELGIGFALEHYGVDTTRFQILDILKPNYIKIDGELMHTLTKDTSLQENIGELAAAATERGILTIAERVENANSMAVLFQLGIDYMQGHYVHEPEVVLQEPVKVTMTSLDAMANN
jgi:diguanylate cyclase (GGDEF)-like protein